MRRLIGISAMAFSAVVAAQPALAADASTSLTDLVAVTGVAPIAGTLNPKPELNVNPETVTMDVAKLGSAVPQADFRLHALMDLAAGQPKISLDDQASRLRRGGGGTMVDYFPLGVDGFHVSGGSRFYTRGPARAGVVDANGLVDMRYVTLLYSPRAAFVRASRRMTPALTMGYTKLLRGGMSLGVEGGAMLGRFDTLAGSLVRLPRLRGSVSEGAMRLSQVARMTFGYHF